MKQRCNSVVRNFFSDYVSWLLIISFLFIVSLVAAIALGKDKGYIWIIPVGFLFIFLLSFPFLILYCKVRKDINDSNIDKVTVRILEIQQDDTFVFKTRDSATVGKIKYRIIDENGNYYLLSTSNEKDMFAMFHPHPTFSVEIEVLKKSRLVLSMRIIDEPKTKKKVREQNYNITHFKKVFGHYL